MTNPYSLVESMRCLYVLIWKDLRIRYQDSVLGIVWAILHPVAATAILVLVMHRWSEQTMGRVSYSLALFAGILPWSCFARLLSNATQVLRAQLPIIRQVSFPRWLIPVSVVASGFVDFVVGFLFFLLLIVVTGSAKFSNVALIPLLFSVLFGTGLGVTLWLSALEIRFKDVRFLTGFLTQTFFFVTPVFYSLGKGFRNPGWFAINPMAAVIEGFRWVLLGAPALDFDFLAVATLVCVILVLSGAWYFSSVVENLAEQL